LYWPPSAKRPECLAAIGPAPQGLSTTALRRQGFDSMPSDGPWTITVPGAVAGWEAMLDRHGKLGLGEVLASAISVANDGFVVTGFGGEEWATSEAKLRQNAAAAEVFLPGGRPPQAGERFANPTLGRALQMIAAEGGRTLYQGELAEKIASAVAEAGGPLRTHDLDHWSGPEWIVPLNRSYRGVDVFVPPPPGQGIVVLEALGILEGCALSDEVDRCHVAIESIKLAFADALAFVADPDVEAVPHRQLLSDGYLSERRATITLDAAKQFGPGLPHDTVFVAAVDSKGGACSFIQSLYDSFGSGVGVAGAGSVLQNRGAGFVLDDAHPNRPAPGKRPYHTIVPSMLGKEGDFIACLGVVGGFMQPQGLLQVLHNVVDLQMDPQQAIDAPRWRWLTERQIACEEGFSQDTLAGLRGKGHALSALPRTGAGGAQMILKRGSQWLGGSDPRKGGRVGAA
jgi:gamma-glutamyltranspeptidase / glutathione hydrolase